MLEYVFFEEEPRRRFQAFLDQHAVPWSLESGQPESIVVVDDSAMDETRADRMEVLYEELFALEQSLFAAQSGATAPPKTKGLPLHLKDGTSLYADLPTELVNRILSVVTPEELDAIAEAIVCGFEDSERRA